MRRAEHRMSWQKEQGAGASWKLPGAESQGTQRAQPLSTAFLFSSTPLGLFPPLGLASTELFSQPAHPGREETALRRSP